jgi:nitroreductase
MVQNEIHVLDFRKPGCDISPLFVRRWSPRAMSDEEVGRDELVRLFEAGRWALSSMNNLPWRFLHAIQKSSHCETFFNLLGPNNQRWCKNATALIVVVSKTTFDFNNKPARTHSYDTGAAWGYFARQGLLFGFVCMVCKRSIMIRQMNS